jgi:hypothetical protein
VALEVDPSPSQRKKARAYPFVLILIGCGLAVVGLLLRTSSSSVKLWEPAGSQKKLILQLTDMYADGATVAEIGRILAGWDRQELADAFARVEVNLTDPIARDQVAGLRRALNLPAAQVSHKEVLAQPAVIAASSAGLLLVLIALVLDALPLVVEHEDEDELLAQALASQATALGPQPASQAVSGAQPAQAQAAPGAAAQPGQPGQPNQPAASPQATAAAPTPANQQAAAPQPGQPAAPGQAPAAPGQAPTPGQTPAQPGAPGQPPTQAAQPNGAPAPANQPQQPGAPAAANPAGAQPAPAAPADAPLLKTEEKKETNKDIQGILSDVFGEEGAESSERQALADGLSEIDIRRLSHQADRLKEILNRRHHSSSS